MSIQVAVSCVRDGRSSIYKLMYYGAVSWKCDEEGRLWIRDHNNKLLAVIKEYIYFEIVDHVEANRAEHKQERKENEVGNI